MKTHLKKIGNSKGITLSKLLLEQYQFEDDVEIIALTPDSALLEGFRNSFDKNNWTW